MSKNQVIKLNETQLSNILSKCVKQVINERNQKQTLNEDVDDLFGYADECLKYGYKFRHAIHNLFDFNLDAPELTASKKPEVPQGCEMESVKYLRDAYYAANQAIENIKRATQSFNTDYGM